MTAATTKIQRSGPAIRAALAEASPDECAQLEAEFAEALARAGAEFDLAPPEAVLDRWWGIAAIRANTLSKQEQEQEQEQLARARAEDFTGLWERDEAGSWTQLRDVALQTGLAGDRASTTPASRLRSGSRSTSGSSSCWRTCGASPARPTTRRPTSGRPPMAAAPG